MSDEKAPALPEEPASQYFEFAPDDLEPGVYDTPQLGQVVTGRVYEARRHVAERLKADPHFKPSSKSRFERQQQTEEEARAAASGSDITIEEE